MDDGTGRGELEVGTAPAVEDGLAEVREASRRLRELQRREHRCLGEFLLALAEFDRAGSWRRLGFATLFEYLQRELGLSRAAAHFRKVASRLVIRYPAVRDAVADGRLCLTSVVELGKVITPDNHAEVVPRFFHRSKQEARFIAAEISPARVIVRREMVTAPDEPASRPADPTASPAGAAAACASRTGADTAGAATDPVTTARLEPGPAGTASSPAGGGDDMGEETAGAAGRVAPVTIRPGERLLTHPERRPDTVEPMTAQLRRLHVTVSREFLDLLARAKAGESRRKPAPTTEAVLTEGLTLLIARQEKRRSCVPAKVKRAVLERDERRCQWPLADGGVCGATVMLEIDHVVPRGRGGESTVENCRVLCRSHNVEAARAAYGDAFMDRFTRRD